MPNVYLNTGYGRYSEQANQKLAMPWTIDTMRFLVSLASFYESDLKVHV